MFLQKVLPSKKPFGPRNKLGNTRGAESNQTQLPELRVTRPEEKPCRLLGSCPPSPSAWGPSVKASFKSNCLGVVTQGREPPDTPPRKTKQEAQTYLPPWFSFLYSRRFREGERGVHKYPPIYIHASTRTPVLLMPTNQEFSRHSWKLD